MPLRSGRINELVTSYREAKVLFTAASMDLFSATSGKHAGAARIASAKGLDPRAATIFLNALVSMGFLKKSAAGYRNSKLAEEFLVPGSRNYVGNNLQYQDIIWNAWSELAGVIKTGEPPEDLTSLLMNRPGFVEGYIRGMDNIAAGPAAEIVRLAGKKPLGEMLDVGGGPGTYTAAFLKANPGMRGTILDLPATLKVTRKILKANPLRGRVRLKPGDYHTADYGCGRHDLVLLSHITHDEGPEEVLNMLRKSHTALKPGGRVVIHDFMLDQDLTAPKFAAMFSVHMLVYTNKGKVYSESEYTGMLKAAGFRNFKCSDVCKKLENRSKVIFAERS